MVAPPNSGVKEGARIYVEGLERIQRRLEGNLEACKSGALPAIVKSDMDLHQLFVELSGSEKLPGLWKQVTSSMMLHYERHIEWMESYAEHKAIYEAIVARDAKAAKAALVRNIR